LLLLSTLALLVWLYLFFAHGGFWLIHRNLILARIPGEQPSVAVIVPARNEAHVIATAVTSLLRQDYRGPLQVLIVDDNSTDDTAQSAVTAAESLERREWLHVITGTELPPGWSGKVWAMQQGWNAAQLFSPEYVFFTDADIEHDPGALGALVAQAQSGSYDLVSVLVKLRAQGFAEKLLIPAFVYFFWMLYPPARISNRRSRVAGAAGGSMLVRAQVLEAHRGLESIRSEIIDDCALARTVKRSGGRLWVGMTSGTRSLRSYETFRHLRDMIARTAFNQLRHSVWLLMVCVVGLLLTFVAPVVLLGSGRRLVIFEALAACSLMIVSYLPVVRFYRVGMACALTLPLAALFYLYATVYSALKYWTGKGGEWKGRVQDM
jgi:hopene-associated glycosyltransferase HpnB